MFFKKNEKKKKKANHKTLRVAVFMTKWVSSKSYKRSYKEVIKELYKIPLCAFHPKMEKMLHLHPAHPGFLKNPWDGGCPGAT